MHIYNAGLHAIHTHKRVWKRYNKLNITIKNVCINTDHIFTFFSFLQMSIMKVIFISHITQAPLCLRT
jgi:hypothetical protein